MKKFKGIEIEVCKVCESSFYIPVGWLEWLVRKDDAPKQITCDKCSKQNKR